MATSTPTPTSLTPAPAAPNPGPARRAAATVLFVLLLVALVARFVFLAWEPAFDGGVPYDEVRPLGDAFWTMNIALGGPSFAISWVATAIFIALLARGMSAAGTIAAAVVTGVGGIVFSLAITAETLPFAFAADAAVFSDDEARTLFETFNGQLEVLFPVILGTQAAIALGVLTFFVIALVSRAVPRWFSIAGILYLIAFAALPLDQLGRPVILINELMQVVLIAGIGWFGLRAARES